MTPDVQTLYANFKKELAVCRSGGELTNLSTRYLGRKGIVNTLTEQLKTAPLDKKKILGIALNRLKQTIQADLEGKGKVLLKQSQGDKWIDVTLPGKRTPIGSIHPTSNAINEISRIFERLGFIRMSYREVEWEYFAFESLNMPPAHPARDDFETFFIDTPPHPKYGRMLLSPHTSSGQVREMRRVGSPPIKMINIAKCYRPNWDATHTPMFHQFEGLCIDAGINITHLKGTIDYFVKEFFGDERETRLRPFHFQFTEPSFEVDITCDICGGTGIITSPVIASDRRKRGNLKRIATSSATPRDDTEVKCHVCKSGWLELGGAGMVHPTVLVEGGVDPKKYSGWAFGFGIERVYMMRGGLKLDDIRVLYSGDVRFLRQF